jgi:hypothetical protein
VPARGGAVAFVALEVDRLLRPRRRGRIRRVEADGHNLEILSGLQRQDAERARQAVDHLRAEHRAVVVSEDEDHRPLAEVVAEPHGRAAFVAEDDVERHVLIEVLIEPDLAQRRRHL